MYGLMWRILPGPWASKLIMMVGLLAGAAALLWFFAFPALSPHMPFNDGAVEAVEGVGADGTGGPETEGEPSEEVPGGAPEEEALVDDTVEEQGY